MVLLTKLKFGQLAFWRSQINQKIKMKKAEKSKQKVAVLSRKHDHIGDFHKQDE